MTAKAPEGRQNGRDHAGRAVSMLDVAEAAGVSHQTVSRVINGHPYVSVTTRARVVSAISLLGYRPNGAARALASGRQKHVTVLTSNTTLYGYAATIQGVEEAARSRGLSVGIRVLDSTEPEIAARELSTNAGNLIIAAYDSAGWRALRSLDPSVPHAGIVGRSFPDKGRGKADPRWAWLDDREAAAEATRYLLELGHETVYHVPIPAWAEDNQRQGGWRDALILAGARVPALLPAGWDANSGFKAGQLLELVMY